MRFVTFFFSGTGNTWWAVREFTEIASTNGHDAEMCSIENDQIKDFSILSELLEKSDAIGFAYPIYGANLPPIMREFITKVKRISENLNKLRQKYCFIITTIGYVNGYGPYKIKKILRSIGLKLKAHINLRLTNNVSTPGLKINPIPHKKLVKRKKKSIKKLDKFYGKIIKNKKRIRGIGPWLVPGMLIRRITAPKMNLNYQRLSINLDTCNNCEICINNCPTNSIIRIDNKITFKEGCTGCYRCYNFCPTHSILYKGKFADPLVYHRYHGPIDNLNLNNIKQ
ncbi:MAG: EFR1 family ferrodoxin [Promethearchaeota archaeon]|nr:MAG: EFR1 family ferrodoxin [Candidatus Lokiarchaeota archaeon]